MSSHYFVKEGQEPALWIHDSVPFNAAADLLAWAPLIIVSDRALEAVVTWGIKIDAVLDLSGEPRRYGELIDDQQPVHIISGADQHSGLNELFHYLQSTHNTAVAIIAEKPEDIISSVDGFPDFEITIQDQAVRWSRIAHGFHKWLPAGSRFRIFSSGGQAPTVDGAGEQDGVFITVEDGMVRILPPHPVWIGEYF